MLFLKKKEINTLHFHDDTSEIVRYGSNNLFVPLASPASRLIREAPTLTASRPFSSPPSPPSPSGDASGLCPGADGGGGGVVLEEALRVAVPEAPPVLEEAPRAAMPEATSAARPEMATQGVLASGSSSAPRGASEEVLAASQAASGGRALGRRPGGHRAATLRNRLWDLDPGGGGAGRR